VLLDALGTLVELEPPWVHLAAALGIEESDSLTTAVRKEMAFYKEHSHEGHDESSLAALRARCADILSWELDREVPVETMMDSIRFQVFPDVPDALADLRARGLRLVCVSNWDVSLPEVLDRCGLGAALDGVVTSAGSGSRKPDPVIFSQALELAGCAADEAVHVGDTLEEDVAGAEAAGIRALLLDRDGGGDIDSLGAVAGAIADR
jgi:putative hydrolase of the HAD superfamily